MDTNDRQDKSADFQVRQTDPFNGGPRLDRLARSEFTPTDRFFVRNHGAIPQLDPDQHLLTINTPDQPPRTLSLTDLRTRFERVSVQAVLQCAGNRRQELIDHHPIPGELPWGAEAISQAEWAGVRLSDVLAWTGVAIPEPDRWHVGFVGLDQIERRGRRFAFGGSIPFAKALGKEVIVAFEMNGAPLTRLHGAPLRVVVPGYVGARSVKWLSKIDVRVSPSDNYFQAEAYRLYPPYVSSDQAHPELALPLGEVSLNAVICEPGPGEAVRAGHVNVCGYALAGGSRTVARVDLSIDGGRTWRSAQLDGDALPWRWRLWHADIELPAGAYVLVVRAIDSAGNSQPADVAQVWNFKGYMNNAWHRVSLRVGA